MANPKIPPETLCEAAEEATEGFDWRYNGLIT